MLEEGTCGTINVSPKRALLRQEAAKALTAQGKVMQKMAERRLGRIPIVGDIVQVPIPDVDRSKLDGHCLTAVVVQVTCE
jgi:hypothetical protein